MDGEELIHRGIKLPKTLDDKVNAEMGETGLDRSSLVRKILFDYYKQKENPNYLIEQMREILLRDPQILKDAVGDIVQTEVQSQLRQILGSK